MRTPLAVLALAILLPVPASAQRTQHAGEPLPVARPAAEPARLALADYDGDGRRDVAVLSSDGLLKLLQNAGEGQFQDVTELAGLGAVGDASFLLWEDFDGDQRSDLLLGALHGPRRLFRNLGNGTFEDVAEELRLARSGGDRSARWFDADADGRLDLFVEGREGTWLHRALEGGAFEEQLLAPAVASAGAAPSGGAVVAPQPAERSGLVGTDADGAGSAASSLPETSWSTSGLPSPDRPRRTSPREAEQVVCVEWIRDALNPGACLQASSVPMPGMLFPPPHDGGIDNVAGGEQPFLGGGRNNRTSGEMPTIGGGRWNAAAANYTTIGGGRQNEALGDCATVGGGRGNLASIGYATAGGGYENEASDSYATVGGGYRNVATGSSASVGGGASNIAWGEHAAIAGGQYNSASGANATIGGGGRNLAGGALSTIGGGELNNAYAEGATVGGGRENDAYQPFSTISGGQSNVAYAEFATVGGGADNEANRPYSVVGGGRQNLAQDFGTVPGGEGNRALGHHSFAAGYNALALHEGAFVWADSRDHGVRSSFAPDSFTVRAHGGTRVYAGHATPSFEITADGSSRFLTADSVTPAMVVAATGRVGIGVASPSDSLQVRGNVALDLNQRIGWSPSGDTFAFNGRTMGHYTLGWFNDPWDGDGATAWISGYSGVRLFAGGAPRVHLNRWGNVGINTSSPQFTLEVNGSAGKPGGGAWSVSSDARLKKDVRPLEGALETLLALRGVSYEYKDPAAIHELPGRRLGFLAQEVEQVLPDWVDQGDNGFKRLTIRGFEALAVEALRELALERDALASENELLVERVAGLEARLARIEAALAQSETTD